MAGRNIQGITVEIGGDTTKLSKAITNLNRPINNVQSELRDVERLLKMDPGNTDLIAQKQRLLAEQIENTKNKLTTLKQADEQAKKQLESGDLGVKQYDALQREIIETTNKLEDLEEKAKQSTTLSTNLTNFGNAAKGASEKTKGLSTAAGGLLGAMAATVPATEELRSDLSKLDNNARQAGVGIDKTRDAFNAFNVVSDETDSSVEATSNLLQAGFTESNLQKAVEGLSGAYLRFPDTLKIESLADSLQETLATGQATGQFGEMLDRLGYGADNFSQGLANCTTEAEKQNYALQVLSQLGLNDTYNSWKANNEEMIKNKEATANLQQSLAKLAEVMLPIITLITQFATKIITAFTSLPQGVQTAIIAIIGFIAILSPLLSIISKISLIMGNGGLSTILTTVKNGFMMFGTAISGAALPIIAIIAVIGSLIAIFAVLWNTNENFRINVIQLWETIKLRINSIIEALKQIFQAFCDLVQTIWNNWGEQIMAVTTTVINVISTIIENGLNIIENIIKLFTSVLKGDWQGAWDAVKNILQSVLNVLRSLVSAAFNGIVSIISGIGGAITGAVQSAFNGAINFLTSLHGRAASWGRDMISGFVDGIWSMIGSVVDAVSSVASTVASWLHFTRPDTGPLRDYETWMPLFGQGLTKGIKKIIPDVSRAISTLSQNMLLDPNVYTQTTQTGTGNKTIIQSEESGEYIINLTLEVPVQLGGREIQKNIIKQVIKGITAEQASNAAGKGIKI